MYLARVSSGYARALEGLSPYLVATPALQARLSERPLGLAVPPGHCFDPTRRASAPFLSQLEQLDQVVSGPLAMAMPRWAFYDCAELPGLVCGFASSAGSVPERLREVWPLEARNGPVPLSMCMAVPMLQRDRWLAYVLCDLQTGTQDVRLPVQVDSPFTGDSSTLVDPTRITPSAGIVWTSGSSKTRSGSPIIQPS